MFVARLIYNKFLLFSFTLTLIYFNSLLLFSQSVDPNQVFILPNSDRGNYQTDESEVTNLENEINPFYQDILEHLNESTNIEKQYNERSSLDIKLQGYEFFLNRFLPISIYKGGIHDDYIIGPGDGFNIILRGGSQSIKRTSVTRDGSIILDFFPPISVAGKTFKEVKLEIENAVKASLIETDVFVSLRKTRTLAVNVVGEVHNPGVIYANGMESITDVLTKAGGIKKTGSLREINLFKNNIKETLDLYPLIFSTSTTIPKNNFLQDGMIIVVPPLKKTAAIVGNVNREGIYEISENNNSVDDIIQFAGGLTGPIEKNYTLKRTEKSGLETVKTISKENFLLKDFDIIFTNNLNTNSFGQVRLTGAVKYPSIYSIDKFPKIKNLISNTNALTDNAYTFSFLILNRNPKTLYEEFSIHNLQNVIDNKSNFDLKTNDNVIILSKKDLEYIKSPSVISILNGDNTQEHDCKALEILFSHLKNNGFENSKNSLYSEILKLQNYEKESERKNDKISNNLGNNFSGQNITISETLGNNSSGNESESKSNINENDICPKIYQNYPSLLSFLIDNIIILKGNFEFPGIHLVDKKTNLKEILKFAKAKSGKVIVSPNSRSIYLVKNRITLEGSFRFPGELNYKKGDTLFTIFSKNNLMIEKTYPFYGLVERGNSQNIVKSYFSFSPRSVLNNEQDLELLPDDKIILFNEDQINIISEKFFSLRNASSQKITETPQTNNAIDNNIIDNNAIGDNISNQELQLNSLLNSNSFDNKSKLEFEFNQDDQGKDNKPYLDNVLFEKQLINELSTTTKIKPKILNLISRSFIEISGVNILPRYMPVGGPTKSNEIIEFSGASIVYQNEITSKLYEKNNEFKILDTINSGDKLFIPSKNNHKREISLVGAFENPRKVSFKSDLKISNVFDNVYQLNDEAYIYFGVIERRNKNNLKNFIPFSPKSVLNKSFDLKLYPSDKIIIYSKDKINELIQKFANEDTSLTPSQNSNEALQTFVGSIEELIKRYSFRIEGAVVNPGQYVIAGKTTLQDIIDVSGGLSKAADLSRIQLSIPISNDNGSIRLSHEEIFVENIDIKSYLVVSGSLIRFPKRESDFMLGNVSISGEIKQPGVYRIENENSLFNLLVKSGGLTQDAFVDGLIFSREEERKREEASVKRLVRELDKSIAAALENQPEVTSFNAESILALRELALAASDFKPIGRVVGNFTDIDVLKSIKLVSGDKIFIPKKPSSVTVVGEVMTPGSILWLKNQNVKKYINLAAGFTELADKDKVFVIAPNGQATREFKLWDNNNVRPGSTIVVPRKIVLTSTLGKISSITSVIYQLTLTLAGIDSLLSN